MGIRPKAILSAIMQFPSELPQPQLEKVNIVQILGAFPNTKTTITAAYLRARVVRAKTISFGTVQGGNTYVAPQTNSSATFAFVNIDSASIRAAENISMTASRSTKLLSILIMIIGTTSNSPTIQAISARASPVISDTEGMDILGSLDTSQDVLYTNIRLAMKLTQLRYNLSEYFAQPTGQCFH